MFKFLYHFVSKKPQICTKQHTSASQFTHLFDIWGGQLIYSTQILYYICNKNSLSCEGNRLKYCSDFMIT